ncbi:mevalonate kinase [Fructobacillus parabroussonetiae]|uniref:phosphomevalonate kinase n=1 Tax=Fructobacillus parabroussonetiae TaxID=2713174 RepID=A0ABS5QXG0_9LACO|nr:phosphomevalonate kinase [Fructobacillus parabroussonetiae]MBS9337896.1 phosphomevalonate kinase [Fructobacillus parabroussonetiae]
MNKAKQFHIPGKLFLAGEYAVTLPGQPAIIAPVDRGLTIEVQTNPDKQASLSLLSDQYEGAYQTNWAEVKNIQSADLATGSWTFVRAALAIFMQGNTDLDFTELPAIQLTISSSMKAKEGKLGLGSSAAVTVAVTMALHAAFRPAVDRMAVFKEAAFAHYLVQRSGSLGDLATAAFNQTIYYQAPKWLSDTKDFGPEDFSQLDWSMLAIQALDWPKDWSFAIVASRQPASTRKALGKNTDLTKLLTPSKEAVMAVKEAIEGKDYDAFKQALVANQKALIDVLPADYQTKKLHDLLTLLKQLDLAGKISGAGFGDNGFVVGDDCHSLFPMKTAARTADLTVIQ